MLAAETVQGALPPVETTTGSYADAGENADPAVGHDTSDDGPPVELHMIGFYEPGKGHDEGCSYRRMPAGVPNAASFIGAYKAPEAGFFIDEAPGIRTRAEIEAALTAGALRASDLSPVLRAAFEGETKAPGANWTLRKEGFVGKREDDRMILHKLPPEAPEVSWPMVAAHDSEGQMLWGITLGGRGISLPIRHREEPVVGAKHAGFRCRRADIRCGNRNPDRHPRPARSLGLSEAGCPGAGALKAGD